jgi:hypothetical protein
MSLERPQSMTEGGRLSQSDTAQKTGMGLVLDPRTSCPQTRNITLFFDGHVLGAVARDERRRSPSIEHSECGREEAQIARRYDR